MSEQKDTGTPSEVANTSNGKAFSRRKFLQYAGASAAAAATFGLVGCNDDELPNNGMEDMVNLGTGNVAILNYAYALEQLEAAFYINVMDNRYSGMSDAEVNILGDIRDHEITHRDFFKAALASNAIQGLTPDFSSIDFTSRSAVLGAAKTFEDLGVNAYNGQGAFIDTSSDAGLTYLLLAGKIVSVEARHASAVSDLINPNSTAFAPDDRINENGLEVRAGIQSSADVLTAASAYIKEDIDFSGMPDQQ